MRGAIGSLVVYKIGCIRNEGRSRTECWSHLFLKSSNPHQTNMRPKLPIKNVQRQRRTMSRSSLDGLAQCSHGVWNDHHVCDAVPKRPLCLKHRAWNSHRLRPTLNATRPPQRNCEFAMLANDSKAKKHYRIPAENANSVCLQTTRKPKNTIESLLKTRILYACKRFESQKTL